MNNPCYQAQQLSEKAIYDQPDFFNPHVDNNDYAEININNNSTNQSISCHVASITADVSAKKRHEEEIPD